MECVSLIFGKALDCLVAPIGRQLGYLYNYRSNVEELKECAQSMKHLIEEAERNGENIEDRVASWFTEIDTFLEDEGRLKTGCSNGFPNLMLRHRLGRKAKKMSAQGAKLLKELPPGRVSYRPEPIAIDAALFDNDYESFNSRDAIVEEVMDALKDSTIKMIGIYGQGGVGKTSLVKEVARKAKAENLFNVVVLANITSTPDVKKIQGEIADMLGLRLDEESEIGRAGRLQQRLKKEKENNTLVILDDLWAGLDLNKLGILFNGDDISRMTVKDMPNVGHKKLKKEKSPGDSKSCKILLTSRSKEVLSSEMDVKENSIFSMEVMEEKEAEKLFKKVAGVSDEDSDELKSLSAKIANKFAKLPMAIVTAGKALKNNKNKFAWENALQNMQGQEMIGVLEPVEVSTKLSYDHLQSEELKSIFLFCACMGGSPSIMDLVKYCIGLGIFQGVYTVKDARDRTNTLINKLKDSGLLSNICPSDCVTMHDMVRHAALSIASKEQRVFTVRYGILDEWPDKDEVERYTAIFLHHCDITDEIPERINCSRLKVFHIDNKDPSLKIPDKLFEGMGELRVLIFIGINLSSLPSSIKCLAKLRMLCLEQCVLGDNLFIIGELKKLRVLSLSGSEFECLPSELGQLGQLQLFDISNCNKLRVIPSNVISRLKRLEELHMQNNLIQWDVEGQTNYCEIAWLAELSYLQQLKSLDIHIPDVTILPRSLFFDKLDCYKIVIGDFKMPLLGDFEMPRKYEASRALALQLKKGNDIHFQKGIKVLFKSVERLFLGELDGVQNVICELNLEGFPCVKHLTIKKNFDIQYIINSTKWEHQVMAFPKLESICLYKLESMEKICNCQLIDGSFHSLKTIKIKICGRLKSLFSFYMVRLLTKLEAIEVSECDSLKDIVVVERQENTDKDDRIEFPQLHSLTLQSLPILTCFYANDNVVPISQMAESQLPNMETEEFSTGNETDVAACLPLFNTKVLVPNLESLELSSLNIKKVWGDQPLPSSYFQNLMKLNVKDCGNLKYLFSFSMAGSLVKLQSLFVKECDMMKDIFNPKDVTMDEARKEVDVFPQLKKIEITCMEKLKTIWHAQASLHSFCSLDSVIIEDCDKLVSVFPGYMVGRFHSLGSLKVINCKLVEEIFDLQPTPELNGGNETELRDFDIKMLPKLKHVWSRDPQGILNFKNLQNVSVNGCPRLENLFPVSVANDLKKLESISVSDCHGMKEIVARDDASNRSIMMFEFPKLTNLELCRLPELGCFYQGTHAVKFQALKCLWLLRCDKLEAFAMETTHSEVKPFLSASIEVISNLEELAIGQREMKWLQDCIGNNVYQMRNIKELVLLGLSSIEILFWFLHRFPSLETLCLVYPVIKEVLPNGSPVSLERIGTVVRLKDLCLWDAYFLHNIGLENDPILQRVEQLSLEQCHYMINLLPSSVSLTHLTYLEVRYCNRLKNLMTSTTAKSLVQLTTAIVIQCEMMEEIVTEEGNEEGRADEIVFSKLKSLELVSLRNLTSFCSSKNELAFRFPSLEKLIVRDCLKLEKFSEKITSTPNLQKVNIVDVEGEEGGKWYWEGDLNATIQKIFTIPFEYSQKLELSCHPELQRVWRDKFPLPDNFFHNLKTLVVEENRFFLSEVFPLRLLPYFEKLEELQVRSSQVEVIFDIDETKLTEINGKVFRLKKMTLDELQNLKCVWSKDPHGIISFLNLQEVVVTNCEGIKTLFPASLAENLVKLKKLEISRCSSLEEIVGKEEEAAADGASRKFEFYSLTSLNLFNLLRLKCFYPGRYTLECHNLERLRVLNCNKLEFASEFPSHQGALGDEDQVGISTSRQHLFLVEKVVPNLESLSLNGKHTTMLSHGHFTYNLFHKLRELELNFYDSYEAAATLPLGFLQKVPNLESLTIVQFNALEEMFPSQKPEDVDSISILARVRALSLYSLRYLSSIGLDNSWLDPLCKNLEDLKVNECPRLTVLVHSSAVSFCNLKRLAITKCDGLVFLFSSSIAKSLVQLEMMIIAECVSIEQIVAQETDESNSDEIIFGKLESLTLSSLSRLVSFYSGNATLQFSALEIAFIHQCPNMKIFSPGDVRAPNFIGIQASSDPYDVHHYIDLNTTVQKLFYEKLALFTCDIYHLKLGDHPALEGIWLGIVQVPKGGFSKLKSLIVDGCHFLSNVIPFNLLPFLNNLEELEVRKCDFVKAIFDVAEVLISETKAIDVGPASAPLSFPLKKLTLEQLPNLEHVWNEDPKEILSFQFLQQVYVVGCKSLVSLFPASVAQGKLERLEELDVQDCEGLVEIVAKDETDPEGASTKLILFPSITLFRVWNLPVLKWIYPGLNNLEWPKLEILDVFHCDQLKIFPREGQDHIQIDVEAILSFEKVFPSLKQLSLNKENIMKIWQGQFQANFLQRVKFLTLLCFHDDSDRFPYGFFQRESLPNVEKLGVACSGFTEIFTTQRLDVDPYTEMFFSQLKGLYLDNLPKLNSIGLEQSWLAPLPENLETLEVVVCPCLVNLVPSTVSFSNLRDLYVYDCDELVHLFTSSTAKSLALLERLSIIECKSIQEIVAKEGDESDGDEITFSTLKTLHLYSLTSLGSFYTGIYVLKFPSLEEVSLVGCSEMKIFCQGDIYAPANVTINSDDDLGAMMRKTFKMAA